ncbi:MFS transporter [Nocardia jinanensis]|uniref:MFS transporter n=1 Tax=Nocardia jinanensis TaxID=382504 RepID=A0A917VMW8_9NOCA|nr:MFS transporter [Nocardia jinanensis]GGK97313.1 MFS transporter [Nocardia jinanensis]
MTSGAATARAVSGPGAWAAFAGCLLSVFMQMIDVTIVNTALPAITADLRASSAQQLLIVSGYSLAFACTLLPAARAGAMTGRRRMFLAAVVAFTAVSVWCGTADSAGELVVARVAQGVAGAGMAAQTIAILTALFPRNLHTRVFALYGATSGFAGLLGPILGGTLLTTDPGGFGWHSIFLMNLPLGVVTLVLAWRYLWLDAPRQRCALDPMGVLLSTVTLFGLLYALSEIHLRGWRPVPCLIIAAALALAMVTVLHERRVARRGAGPLLRLDLFGDRGFAIGSIVVTGFFGVFTAFVFAISITLQDVLDFSPLETGIAMTPFAFGAGAGALVSPVFVQRWGVRTLAGGLALFAVCVIMGVAYVNITDGRVNMLLCAAPVFLCGFGAGLFAVPLQPIMLSGLDDGQMAEASGLLPTIEQIGNGVGLALLSAVFFRAHTLGGSTVMLSAIAVVALTLAAVTLALPDPAPTPDRSAPAPAPTVN